MRLSVFTGAALIAFSINPLIFSLYDPDFKYTTFAAVLFGALDFVDFVKNLNRQ
ncbi:hypothetical protein KAR91_67160 [Candidatus Pacearchaeota archaeon]|nr:hypothetical protein [Candidatus Pacearchaeota archaeon]